MGVDSCGFAGVGFTWLEAGVYDAGDIPENIDINYSPVKLLNLSSDFAPTYG